MSERKSDLESGPVIVRLYSKPGCHLCERAREVLERVRSRVPFELVEEDIRADPAVFSTYRYSIPVVILATGEVLHHPLEEARVEDSLRKASGGTPVAHSLGHEEQSSSQSQQKQGIGEGAGGAGVGKAVKAGGSVGKKVPGGQS